MIRYINQTHVRILLSDKKKLDRYMKRYGIKSQIEALNRLFRRLK